MSFALIPYLEQPSLDLGFAQIHAWGTLVAIGFLFGTSYAARWMNRNGLDGETAYDYGMWVFVGGFTGAHLVHALFYEPHRLAEDPLFLLRIWEGVSSFGGFLGAAVASVLFFKKRGTRFVEHANPLALGMAPGWAIGRIGCFFAHDHIGARSDFILAVDFPTSWGPLGGPRHDLGLYDSILSWILFAVLLFLARNRPRHGLLAGVLCAGYALPRFFFDFLRATDATYGGLTPGQYGSVVLFIFGVALAWSSRGEGRDGEPGKRTPSDA